MGKIKVQCDVGVYEVDGKEIYPSDTGCISVLSHGTYNTWVVVHLPNGTKLTVVGRDLIRAIQNCMESGNN